MGCMGAWAHGRMGAWWSWGMVVLGACVGAWCRGRTLKTVPNEPLPSRPRISKSLILLRFRGDLVAMMLAAWSLTMLLRSDYV